MRLVPFALLALAPATVISCVAEDDTIDLGAVSDGKSDAPAIQDRAITVPKRSAPSKPGVRNYTVRSTVNFAVSIAQTTDNEVKVSITNADTGVKVESTRTTQPTVTATGDGTEHEYTIRVENWAATTLRAKLSALGQQTVSPALLAAARANLDRVTRVAQFDKINAFHDTATGDVKAGDDAFGQHDLT